MTATAAELIPDSFLNYIRVIFGDPVSKTDQLVLHVKRLSE